MKPIGNVRESKKKLAKTENMVLVGEMEDNSLVITHNGMEQVAPILGIFTIDTKYYVALLIEEAGKEVVVIYNVINYNGEERIQVISSQEEWNKVSEAWKQIVDASADKI